MGGLPAVTQLRALWRSWRKLCGRQKVGKEVAVEVVRGVPLQLWLGQVLVNFQLTNLTFNH